MLKVALISRDKASSYEIKDDIKSSGIEITRRNPDCIISYGGDGTFFISERLYPGVPKVVVKKSQTCKICNTDNVRFILDLLKDKHYKIRKLEKLEASNKNKKIKAVNDIIIKNEYPGEALRFSLKINNKTYKDLIIGDGLVISTPLGSSAYFKSITRKTFKNGIGIAFNNTTEKINPLILNNKDLIEVNILRNYALLSADNDRNIIKTNKTIRIKLSEEKASIIEFNKH